MDELTPGEEGFLRLSLRLENAGLPLLTPTMLEPLAQDALAALMRAGESENTLRSYRTALRYWAGWFSLRYGQAIALPVPVPAVLQFVVDHAKRTTDRGERVTELPPALDQALVTAGLKASLGPPALATLEHRLSVLSKLHRLKQHDNPCQAVSVRELMTRVRRGYAKSGERAHPKPALTREPLEAMLETCDGSLAGLRDRALLLFAWGSGGRRRSEVALARVEDLRQVAPDAFVFKLAISKTNQAGEDLETNDKPLVGRAAQALQSWLVASGIQTGPLFRRIRRGGHLGPDALTPSAVRDIVRDRCKRAGLEDEFSAHSLRSGFVTEAARQNIPLPQAMAMTGHRSLESFRNYFRDDPVANVAARMLDTKPIRSDEGEQDVEQ